MLFKKSSLELNLFGYIRVWLGALGSSAGRASDSGSRSPGFETSAGHLAVGSDST